MKKIRHLVKLIYYVLFKNVYYRPAFDIYYYTGLLTKNLGVNFIDIGANEGQSIESAINNFKNIHQIVSVEPIVNIKLKSIINYYSNRFDITLIDRVVGGFGLSNFFINSHTGLSSTLKMNLDYNYIVSNGEELPVKIKSVTLDSVLNKIVNRGLVNILKIDTQGSELSILSLSEAIKNGEVDILIIETILINKYLNSTNYVDLMSYLKNYGYILIDIQPFFKEKDSKFVDDYNFGQFTEMDLLYVHKDSNSKYMFGLIE